MKKRFAPCRLSFVFAKEAPVSVILRRGPSAWVEVIKWQTNTDAFEHGHWFRGRIYGERCGLSPNGKLFVYFASKYGNLNRHLGYKDTYTAVSKPPYLTALAMWPQGSTWGGGGKFIDDATLRLAYASGGRTLTPHSGKTKIFMEPAREHHPAHAPKNLNIEWDLEEYSSDTEFRSSETYSASNWNGRDHSGHRIFVRDGRLYRVDNLNTEHLLKDFNFDKPKTEEAPEWARQW